MSYRQAGTHTIARKGRSRVLFLLGAAIATLGSAAYPGSASVPVIQQAGLIIYVPGDVPDYPVIVLPRRSSERQQVTVRFIAEGDDWATISLNSRPLFKAFNTNRDYTVQLDPGAYYLEISGVTRFDRWYSGYLDVGRDQSNIIVIRYGKNTGIRVSGAPGVWLPD